MMKKLFVLVVCSLLIGCACNKSNVKTVYSISSKEVSGNIFLAPKIASEPPVAYCNPNIGEETKSVVLPTIIKENSSIYKNDSVSKIQPSKAPYAPSETLSNLDLANIVFNHPEKMNIKETTNVQLLLSLTKSIEELKKEINEKNPGPRSGANIIATNMMEAILESSDFDIKQMDPPSKKGVFKDAITEWNWEVKPKSVGTYRLHITLIAYLGDKPWTKSYDEFLEVYITPTQKIGVWWSKYWQWVITVLIIPVLPFAYKLVKKLYEKYRTRNYIK